MTGSPAGRVFGDPALFAIEVQDVENVGGAWCARLGMWFGGERLGHDDQVSMVATLASSLRNLIDAMPQISVMELEGLAAPSWFATFRARVFDEDPRWKNVLLETGHPWCQLVLCPNQSESFDGLFAFAACETGRDRVVWQNPRNGAIGEVSMAPGGFVSIVRPFLDEYPPPR